jgi:hypothetical protein
MSITRIFLVTVEKKNNLNCVKFMAYFLLDPGSGMNIPDPQLFVRLQFHGRKCVHLIVCERELLEFVKTVEPALAHGSHLQISSD